MFSKEFTIIYDITYLEVSLDQIDSDFLLSRYWSSLFILPLETAKTGLWSVEMVAGFWFSQLISHLIVYFSSQTVSGLIQALPYQPSLKAGLLSKRSGWSIISAYTDIRNGHTFPGHKYLWRGLPLKIWRNLDATLLISTHCFILNPYGDHIRNKLPNFDIFQPHSSWLGSSKLQIAERLALWELYPRDF